MNVGVGRERALRKGRELLAELRQGVGVLLELKVDQPSL